MIQKAPAADFRARFREIVADPLNMFIARHRNAGIVEGGWVYTHAGLRVRIDDHNAYYGNFSDILVVNRGVHEPLEEFIFQQWLIQSGSTPVMLELGSYWAHYSMWLKSLRPNASVNMVEADAKFLMAGKSNFDANSLKGCFIQDFVGNNGFTVDNWIEANDIRHLDLLHADIQGCEVEMLEGCVRAFSMGLIDRFFVSTHSQKLHQEVLNFFDRVGYLIEVSSDFDDHTSSYDGLVCAAHPSVNSLFKSKFDPWSRVQIADASPYDRLVYAREIFACMV